MKWHKENGKHLGFVDGTYLYRVAKDEDGWYWEYVPDMDGFGYGGFDTAEEAKAEAEADAKSHDFDFDIDGNDLLLDLDLDLEEAYWDEVAHERMEIAKFGEW